MLLARVKGVRVVPAGHRKSTTEMWNFGADMACGKYIAFLAEGCAPLSGWLNEMVRTFRDQPEAGLVGSQIILPDGLIWEAGGITGEAGVFCRLGCGANPFQPEFSYLREVDFCSAVSFMVPRKLFMQVGGIAEIVCDDLLQAGARLCVALRLIGRKAVSYTHLTLPTNREV